MGEPFKFKQFKIHQDRCAMKIGTDGVLLGAWTSLKSKPNTILDIGAGTGLLSLMMAQRCDAENIEGLEIEANAFEQCVVNFEASPWADRLFCYHAGLHEFLEEIEEPFDLIISNPPFYTEKVPSGVTSRDIARQNRSLPFEELLLGVVRLLASDGLFATIIPFREESNFLALATKNGLFPKRILRVRGNPDTKIKRSLLEFGFNTSTPTINELIIELERHQYTKEYIALTKNFYLKM